MKKVLITGISRGLGKILADFLSQHDCIVYGTVREIKSFKDSACIRYFHLDLQDESSIDRMVDQVYREAGNIDIIIHNAGIAYLDPADVLSNKETRHIFDVNFFGPLSLTKALLPKLRVAGKGKLIFISSVVSIDHWPSLGVYAASKAALECLAFEWAVLLKQWNIDVSIIRANPLPTNMQILKSINSQNSPYEKSFCNELLWESLEDVCDLLLKIINTNTPKFEYVTGEYSAQTIDAILRKDAYEHLINKYRKNLGIYV